MLIFGSFEVHSVLPFIFCWCLIFFPCVFSLSTFCLPQFNNLLLYCVPKVIQVGSEFQVHSRIDVEGIKVSVSLLACSTTYAWSFPALAHIFVQNGHFRGKIRQLQTNRVKIERKHVHRIAEHSCGLFIAVRHRTGVLLAIHPDSRTKKIIPEAFPFSTTCLLSPWLIQLQKTLV